MTKRQIIWLRGLSFCNGRWIVMCAMELGDPEVSELQSTGLVQIADLLDGKNWRITSEGEAALKRTDARAALEAALK